MGPKKTINSDFGDKRPSGESFRSNTISSTAAACIPYTPSVTDYVAYTVVGAGVNVRWDGGDPTADAAGGSPLTDGSNGVMRVETFNVTRWIALSTDTLVNTEGLAR